MAIQTFWGFAIGFFVIMLIGFVTSLGVRKKSKQPVKIIGTVSLVGFGIFLITSLMVPFKTVPLPATDFKYLEADDYVVVTCVDPDDNSIEAEVFRDAKVVNNISKTEKIVILRNRNAYNSTPASWSDDYKLIQRDGTELICDKGF